jgi:hypothetical protein
MNCTRCDGTGFLNYEDGPEDGTAVDALLQFLEWKKTHPDSDMQICDCCGNGEDGWYGTPGEHYSSEDPPGHNGPYAYNGGLCCCH